MGKLFAFGCAEISLLSESALELVRLCLNDDGSETSFKTVTAGKTSRGRIVPAKKVREPCENKDSI